MLSASGVPCISRNSYCIACSHAEWDGLGDHLGDVPWKTIFKFCDSAAVVDFVSGFSLEFMHNPSL